MSPLFLVSMLVSLAVSLAISGVGAQSSSPDDFTPGSATNFQPSLAVVIGVLVIMFSLTFILLIYAKCCHRGSRSSSIHGDNNLAVFNRSRRYSGIDKTVIESLPFFRFSSLKGSKQGLECSVCLSKFEDIEILRLLPKCKHAFHINCIDRWLEKHSSCPLCRQRVSVDDPTLVAYSNSFRFLWSQSDRGEESNIELYVQREENRQGSSRFGIGSFRKTENQNKDTELLIQEDSGAGNENDRKALHKFNHKIIVSDFVFKNRWSNVTSSDLMFLNSELLNEISSDRFPSSLDSTGQFPVPAIENEQIVKIKEEIEVKRSFEMKVNSINKSSPTPKLPSTSNSTATLSKNQTSRIVMNHSEKRSMSEITALSRFQGMGVMNRTGQSASGSGSALSGTDVKEDRIRQAWLPIARRTVQWFANREQKSIQSQDTVQHLEV
ncbi:hypothetical protein SLEP1_g18529 [Rubroshorea leprosula]|uniref:RING-type E3 ubiquitin transferase n=1 Tax=Rubroshorea leprosula TaxID=152421 RepID=A0AAV5J8C6_9ROSI|nr:hypothetical protein SLEP1_g18529 [Rubroshorea leprosula]